MGKTYTKGRRSRALVFESAVKIIARDGMQALTVRGIAKEAGLSIGGVQFHLPKKEDVLFEIIQYVFKVLPAEEIKKLGEYTGLEYLIELLEMNYKMLIEKNEFYHVVLISYYYTQVDERFRELHAKNFENATTKCADRIQAYCREQSIEKTREEIDEFAWSCINLIEGSMLFTYVSGETQKERLRKELSNKFRIFF